MIIDFACKKINQEELIRCSFNLNKTEYKLLMFLLREKKQLTIKKVSEKIGLTRSSVQKAVKKLVKKNLVKRVKKNLVKGSFVFEYKTNNKKELKKKMNKIVFDWFNGVKKAIQKI